MIATETETVATSGYAWPEIRTPHVCPACLGRGMILPGDRSTTTDETCRSCDGTGTVWR